MGIPLGFSLSKHPTVYGIYIGVHTYVTGESERKITCGDERALQSPLLLIKLAVVLCDVDTEYR